MNRKKNKNTSEKRFGYLFMLIFLILAFYPKYKGSDINYLFLFFSFSMFILAYFFSTILSKPTKYWIKFGQILHFFISPIILFVVYFLSIIIMGFFLKLLGKDPLQKKYNQKIKSYWSIKEKNSRNSFNFFNQY